MSGVSGVGCLGCLGWMDEDTYIYVSKRGEARPL